MCVVSMVGDYWRDRLPQQPYYPGIQPHIAPPGSLGAMVGNLQVTRAEFDALKKDVEELKKLLAAAKQFDEATGEPDCEHADKIALIKKLAKLVGVDMSDVLGG